MLLEHGRDDIVGVIRKGLMRRVCEVEEDLARVDGDKFLRDGTRGQRGPGAFEVEAQTGGQESSSVCRAKAVVSTPIYEERERERGEKGILGDGRVGRGKNCGQLLDEMRTVAGVLQLVDHVDDDIIVDAFCVYLCQRRRVVLGRRWRRVVVGFAVRRLYLFGRRLDGRGGGWRGFGDRRAGAGEGDA